MTKEVKVITAIGLVTLFVFLGAVLLLSSGSDQKVGDRVKDDNLLINNSNHKIASESAKVTIVEFADFQCPACGQAYPQIKQILKDYEGKVNFIYRHFPLPQHQNAILAAKAAEAAGEQGKFWEMSNLLFVNQTQWSERSNAAAIFNTYADQLQLNSDQFTQSISGNNFQTTIDQDRNDGTSLGVNSTPTIFINGQKLVQAPTYSNLEAAIKTELTK